MLRVLIFLLISFQAQAGTLDRYLDRWEHKDWNHHEIREAAKSVIWKKGMPDVYPEVVQRKNGADLIVRMKHGFVSRSRLTYPNNWNREYIIYHRGHSAEGWKAGRGVINRFLRAGYAVVAMSMPLTGDNSWPKTIGWQKVKGTNHNILAHLEKPDLSPLELFFTPVLAVVNYVGEAHMTGESGGGYITAVYSAIDGRINVSAPVAGDLPLFATEINQTGVDYEYKHPELNGAINFLDMMVLAGCSGKRLQILHKGDQWFKPEPAKLYKKHVKRVVRKCGGTWELYITDKKKHGYGTEAAEIFLKAIR